VTLTWTVDITDPVILDVANYEICNDAFPETLTRNWTDNCSEGGIIEASIGDIIDVDKCSQTREYTFSVTDDCDNTTTETVTITREWDEIDNCETVFGNRQESECFLDNGFSRWGWTTQITEEGTYEFNLYAGNGNDCDPTDGPGTLAGIATLYYDGSTAKVVYDMNDGFVLSEAHVYIGCTMFPQTKKGNTIAPGQYNFNPSLGGTVDTYTVGSINVTGDFYIIIHGVSCEITCECSSGYTYTGNNGETAFEGDSVDDCEDSEQVVTNNTQEAKTASSFKAYPVPFNDVLTVEYKYEYKTNVKIQVYDTKGLLITRETDNKYEKGTIGTTALNLSRVADQTLIIKVISNREVMSKMVISKSIKK